MRKNGVNPKPHIRVKVKQLGCARRSDPGTQILRIRNGCRQAHNAAVKPGSSQLRPDVAGARDDHLQTKVDLL